jgi:excisionase family DNA binding protein
MECSLPQLMPLLEVARSLSVSPHTVRSWVKKGRLKPTRVCRRLLFSPDEITRFIALQSASEEQAS